MHCEPVRATGTAPSNAPTEGRAFFKLKPGAYLSQQGLGLPDGEECLAAIRGMTGVAAMIQKALEKGGRANEKLGPLETLCALRDEPSACWRWRLVMHVPDCVTTAVLELAKHLVHASGGEGGLEELRLARVGPRLVVTHLPVILGTPITAGDWR